MRKEIGATDVAAIHIDEPFSGTTTVIVPSSARAAWVRWVIPSIADIIFIALIGVFGFSPLSARLLNDADTGWHIINGQLILAAHSVPRTDSFSYTRAGQPWFAWEWLYEVVIAAIHQVAGLNGVVLFTAVIIAATFALLFRFVLRRTGNGVVALCLTLLALSASQIHMLARPHVLSWLIVVLWAEVLYRFEEGKRSALCWLPPLMLLWVNMHGSFILGLALIFLFGCAQTWEFQFNRSAESWRKLKDLAIAFCVCAGVTFVTPYGYKLYVHVFQFLSNRYMMNLISEYLSPDFHWAGLLYFEIFILLVGLGLAIARERITSTDCFVLLFSLHAGLYAVRNVPVSAILMSFAIGPMLAGAIRARHDQPNWLYRVAVWGENLKKDMTELEQCFRRHYLATAAVILSAAIALNGGRVASAQVMSEHFSEKKFPVKAAEFMAATGIRDHFFNTEDWSGYLIYKLYPGTKVYADSRFDFYGEDFAKECQTISTGAEHWQVPLDKYQVKWVLIAKSLPLSSVLRESKAWKLQYDDGLAMIYQRVQ